MMTQTTGPGNYFKLRAIVIRKAIEDDIFKRASLLTKDSVHGPFDGTVRVDEENSTLVINGNPVKVIYATNPDEVNYADHEIHNPIVIDNTGVYVIDKEGDLTTPKGIFNLGNIYYRSDRVQKPFSKLKSISIKKNMGWCDDPNSKFYNKLIRICPKRKRKPWPRRTRRRLMLKK